MGDNKLDCFNKIMKEMNHISDYKANANSANGSKIQGFGQLEKDIVDFSTMVRPLSNDDMEYMMCNVQSNPNAFDNNTIIDHSDCADVQQYCEQVYSSYIQQRMATDYKPKTI